MRIWSEVTMCESGLRTDNPNRMTEKFSQWKSPQSGWVTCGGIRMPRMLRVVRIFSNRSGVQSSGQTISSRW